MSKRAETAAMNAYPDYPSMDGGYVTQRKQRHCFIRGYEQAEKDTIRTVKTWLSEIHRVCDITDENGYRVELRNLVASLEKTMEEE